MNFVRTHQVKEFIDDLRLAIQIIDVERSELFHSYGNLDLVIDIFDDPRHLPINGPFLFTIVILLIVDVENNK